MDPDFRLNGETGALSNYSHIEIHFHGNFGTERRMLQKSEAEERPVKMQHISTVGAEADSGVLNQPELLQP